jgi:hypothetical protein
MMASQDAWRRNPSPLNVDMAAIGSSETAWLLLLTCEDEFARAASTQFHRAHPEPDTVLHYCSLYRNSRFSDHMLGRWVLERGPVGPLRGLIPLRYLHCIPAQPAAPKPYRCRDPFGAAKKELSETPTGKESGSLPGAPLIHRVTPEQREDTMTRKLSRPRSAIMALQQISSFSNP